MALLYNIPASPLYPLLPENYSYTGTSKYVYEGNNNWSLKFLTSGTFVPTRNVNIDIFAVAGGSGGANGTSSGTSAAGGSGGQATTIKNQVLLAGQAYDIVVGEGGAASSFGSLCSASGSSSSPVYEFGETSGEQYAGSGGSGGVATYANNQWTCDIIAPTSGEAGGGQGSTFVMYAQQSTSSGTEESSNSQTVTTRSNYSWSDVGSSTNLWKNYPSTGTSTKTLTFNFSSLPSDATITAATLHTSVDFEGWYVGTWTMEINDVTYTNANSSDIPLTGYTFSNSILTTPTIKITYTGKSTTASYDDISKSYSAANHTFTLTVTYTSSTLSSSVLRTYCDAEENTGGGGGGGPSANIDGYNFAGGAGGSGIVIIRNAR